MHLHEACMHAYECDNTFDLSSDPFFSSDSFEDVFINGFCGILLNIVSGIGFPSHLTIDKVLDDDSVDGMPFFVCGLFAKTMD